KYAPRLTHIEANYFRAFGNRILLGRAFASADRPGAPNVAIVNTAAASAFWPGQRALGQQVFLGDSGSAGELLTVVGVADNMKGGQQQERHWPTVYRPFEQARVYHPAASLYVRIADNRAEALTASVAA